VHVWIDETRPGLEGARLTGWELASAGIPHTLVPDATAGHLIATGRVDAVVVGAYAVAANGDVVNVVGTYPLAVLAARHAVPFYVCASRSSIDLTVADGASLSLDYGDGADVRSLRGVRVAPPGTVAEDPRADITPAELITAIVTGDAVVRPPFRAALEAGGR
jgi:methylthioribose-1-phosphate isomerase